MIAAALLLTVTATSSGWVQEIVEGQGPLPPLEQVQRMAVQALDAGGAGWARRARLRGLVPRLDVAVGTDADLDVRDSVTTSRSRTTTEGRAFGFEISARWDFGDLVFSDLELRANREALARSAARRLVRDRVTQLYFQRLELLLEPASIARDVKAARLDGLIRAYTSDGSEEP